MPIFRVKSVKIYTGQKKFTQVYPWDPWQIWGMCIAYITILHTLKRSINPSFPCNYCPKLFTKSPEVSCSPRGLCGPSKIPGCRTIIPSLAMSPLVRFPNQRLVAIGFGNLNNSLFVPFWHLAETWGHGAEYLVLTISHNWIVFLQLELGDKGEVLGKRGTKTKEPPSRLVIENFDLVAIGVFFQNIICQ